MVTYWMRLRVKVAAGLGRESDGRWLGLVGREVSWREG